MLTSQSIPLRRAGSGTLRSMIALLAGALLLITVGPSPLSAAPSTVQPSPRRLLVKLDLQAGQAPELALSAHALSNWEPLPLPGWVRLTVTGDHERMLAALRADPTVKIVEEDHRIHLALVPNDTYWPLQWGPEIVRAPAAWNTSTGSQSVIVAVLDTGIDRYHGDLLGQLWVNPGEIPGNGQDDDGNGYVDDVHGWNTLNEGGAIIDDDHGHGTHVSGIIAANGNNERGIAGMAWGSRLMVVKVLDQNGDGTYSGLAAGLVYAADNGARIANLSLGGTVPSQILEEAVDYAHARGTLVVVSAGNTSSDIQYPAAYGNALAVAASTRYDTRASYSCYGPEMDLAAPGSSIYSTCMGNGYCYKSGTSMAAPHVAGLAALLVSQQPSLSPDQVAQLLRATAQDLDDPGWDPYTGWGRIDAYHALVRMQAQFHYYLPMIWVNQ